jgi:hypothetical protein
MKYGLPGTLSGVEDEAVLSGGMLIGQSLRDRYHLCQQHRVRRCKLSHVGVRVLGDDEEVHGGLRVNVADDYDPLILEQHVSGNLARDDPREDRR